MRVDEVGVCTLALMLTFAALLRGRGTGGLLEGARIKRIHHASHSTVIRLDSSPSPARALLLPGPDANISAVQTSALAPSSAWPDAPIERTASLLPSGRTIPIAADRHALALASGCLSAQHSSSILSCQFPVSVAVTADLHAIAFDSSLSRLWESPLLSSSFSSFRAREAVALVSNHPAREGESGLVVVGASLLPSTSAAAAESADTDPEVLLEEEHRFESTLKHGAHASSGLLAAGHGADGSTFLLVAFDGKTGAERWRTHAFHELEEDDAERDPHLHTDGSSSSSSDGAQHKDPAMSELHPQHGARPGKSISACKEYRESMMAAMPHMWNRPGDASAELGHFVHHKRLEKPRGHVSSQSPHKPDSKSRYKSSHKRNSNSERRKLRPAGFSLISPREHPHMPNVVVLHARRGIEAVELHTGQPVCELPMQQGQVHVDLDGDGSLDHVQRSSGECSVDVTTGVPPRESLFKASGCSGLSRKAALAWPHVTPHYGRVTVAKEHHSILMLNSKGEVVSVGNDGSIEWSVTTGASFSPGISDSGSDEAVVPSIQPIGLKRGRGAEAILVIGAKEAALLGLNGQRLATASLPEPPVGKPTIIDVDSDGYADVLVPTERGQLVFHQRSPGAISELRIIIAGLGIACAVASLSSADSINTREHASRIAYHAQSKLRR